MNFYNEARVDGLKQRVETPLNMMEYFQNRDDFLFYRYVQYGPKPKKFGPADEVVQRPIIVS